ncbi:MAG: alpha-amylase family glycosyl hydrolase [Ferruginibacter sp.]
MKKLYFVACCLCSFLTLHSQSLLTWIPQFPTDNGPLNITVDCNKGNRGLLNYEGGNSNNIYVHMGVITNLSTGPSDWKYTKFTYGTADPLAHATPLGSNKYSYNIANIRSFFNVPVSETILKVTCIFRNAAGTLKQVNSDNSDMYIPVYAAGEFAVRFTLPPFEPRYVPWLEPVTATAGSTLAVTGVSSLAGNLTLKLNGSTVATATSATSISNTITFSNSCNQVVVLEGTNGTVTKKDSFTVYIPPVTATGNLPAGVKDGINYSTTNNDVTLVLFAPLKQNVVVIGDFSNWAINCNYQMTRTPDGQRYFITLTGLIAGTIYKYQYVVDGNLKVADPYTELVLDPENDQYINSTTFPNLPAYPTGSTTGIVSTFQPGAPAYAWTTTGYTRPDKRNIVVYELLLRDFLASSNWQTLTDTLNYIKNLGINAIEILPFNEFEGNSSWGYNPDFYFAPDKAYGTKNNLKKFIDEAHKKGMAVIMDAVLNQATGKSPLAQLYWDPSQNRPAANSPFFNVTSPHPYSIFNDFNHEADATKYMVSRYIRHWLTEYRLDGFRWDLSKGFTQKVCGDVSCWNAYDASRVAIWQRYYDSAQSISTGSYYILEHLANDDEEAALADRGMLLWGKMTDQFNQNTMGYNSNNNLGRAYYKNRSGWNQPLLVTYAESHDEERIMYKNLTFGNSANAAHNVKDLPVALKRTKAMQAVLLMLPGPKMIWEFGELGYDHSIFECTNGTVPTPYGNDQCKLDPKPILWSYAQDPLRKRMYNVVAALNKLRNAKPATFNAGVVTGNLDNGLVKQYNVVHTDLSVVVVANFDVNATTVTVNFPSAGNWSDYLVGSIDTITAGSLSKSMQLAPGEYKVLINKNIKSGLETIFPVPPVPVPAGDGLSLIVYPNPLPFRGNISYTVPGNGQTTIVLYDYSGQRIKTIFEGQVNTGTYVLPVHRSLSALAQGLYIFRITQNGQSKNTVFYKTKP